MAARFDAARGGGLTDLRASTWNADGGEAGVKSDPQQDDPRTRRVAVALFALGALAAVVWALLDGRFRDPEGVLRTPVCLPLAAACACALLARAAARGWLAAGSWFALGLLGQAFVLQLYHQGPRVSYQHFWPHSLAGVRALAWVGLGLQALLVLPAGGPLAGKIARRWSERWGPWRLALLLAIAFAIGTKLFRPAPAFAIELVVAFALHALQFATLCVGLERLSPATLERWDARLERLLGPPRADAGAAPGRLDRCALALAAWAFLAALVLGWIAYEHHPHVPDEVAYLLHAEYLAAGRLHLDPPPVPAGFDVDLMFLHAGRWYSPVPIGWPAVLAVGAWLGVPWLVNPLLGAASVLLAYLFFREIASLRYARLATALLAFSPWATFLNTSFMTHSLTLACALLAALGVARARRSGKAAWTVAAGVGLGVVGLIRPLEGICLAGLLGLWAIGLGARRLRLASIVALVLSAAAVGALGLAYNAEMTGSALKFPIMDYVDNVYGPGKNSLGFGPDKGLAWSGLDPFPGHGLRDVLANTNFNLFAIDVELFGWSSGSLLLALALVLTTWRAGRDRWMLVVAATVIALHALYWFSGGPDFGARYWYLTLVPCIALSASGAQHLAQELAPASDAGRRAHGVRVFAGIGVLCLWSLATFFPWRAIDKYHHYRGMRPDVRALARQHDFGRSLVLVRGERHPDYGSAAVYNPVDWEADGPIYAWDRDAATRRALLEHYADRDVWVLAGPSVTERGFEIVEGPLAAAELLAREGAPR